MSWVGIVIPANDPLRAAHTSRQKRSARRGENPPIADFFMRFFGGFARSGRARCALVTTKAQRAGRDGERDFRANEEMRHKERKDRRGRKGNAESLPLRSLRSLRFPKIPHRRRTIPENSENFRFWKTESSFSSFAASRDGASTCAEMCGDVRKCAAQTRF